MIRQLRILAVLLCTLVIAPFAFAHSHPVSMAPDTNATVDAPASVVMHFSGPLEPKFSSITVSNATGHVVHTTSSVVAPDDAKLMTLTLPKLPAGVYTVDWVAVSTDTHRMTGTYTFTIK
jgi:methionine-rich copper-binding protein CopC